MDVGLGYELKNEFSGSRFFHMVLVSGLREEWSGRDEVFLCRNEANGF